MKTCTKCKIEKQKSEFHKNSSRKDGLQSLCKVCRSDHNAANRDRQLAYDQIYRAANREHRLMGMRKYYADNRERITEYQKQWRYDNPEKCATYSRNRKARARNAEGTHTAADIRNLLELQRHKCAYCKICVKDGYHADHIVALVNGGSNDPENLQILCPTCNLKKQARCPIEFAQQNGLLL